MKGDLNIVLWMGGMLFGVAAFAVKVGLGLAFGKYGGRGTAATLAGYLVLFVIIALLSGTIMGLLGPILGKGPYLHGFVAAGMVAWGVATLRGVAKGAPGGTTHRGDSGHSHAGPLSGSLLLLVPCPVCLIAMAFSTWSALSVIHAPAASVGLGLGLAFCIMTLLVMVPARIGKTKHPETALGLTMITLGLYFVAALFLPAKIEEARAMYASKASGMMPLASHDALGVMAVLVFLAILGFAIGARKGVVR
jgi:predicted transporter